MNKNNTDSAFYTVKRTLQCFSSIAWKYHKGYFLLQSLSVIVGAAAPFVGIIFTPLIVDELLGNRDMNKLLLYAALLVILNGLFSLLSSVIYIQIEKYGERFQNIITNEISKRAMELDFQMTEDKKVLDQLNAATEGMSWYSGGINGVLSIIFHLIRNALQIVGTTTLLVINAPVILAVIAVVLLIKTILNDKINKIEIYYYKKLSKINRLWGYYAWELKELRYGKDIRLYNAAGLMLDRYNNYLQNSCGSFEEQFRANIKLDIPISWLNTAFNLFNYTYLGVMAILGKITLGVFTQMLTAANTFNQSMSELITNIQQLVKNCSYAYEYVKFMEYPAAISHGERHIKNTPHIFEFKNVSFKYPNTEVMVLKNVNLTLSPGEHLSVVGLNGAGKTTLVKLICRLYDVTDGEILLDGVNIKEYDYSEYMSLFSPVFQDFKLFAFSFRENIALDKEISDEELNSLVQQVGLEKLVNSMDNGVDNMLFKGFDDKGVEPSGGEQQKIAIARALYKKSPVVILDEPTAALDPVAEYEIYRQFHSLVGGKTAIYISHRLSSCKFCDRIAVFSEGTVKEYGTHDELVRLQKGIYSEMFAAQAQYYN